MTISSFEYCDKIVCIYNTHLTIVCVMNYDNDGCPTTKKHQVYFPILVPLKEGSGFSWECKLSPRAKFWIAVANIFGTKSINVAHLCII
mmetsp:Transcript_36503/g.63675  ORF Transcript_36503/g.63675 Transcript_36503/m.63675 type:complete len:89 (-) Transcript_36503:902-1168(-)